MNTKPHGQEPCRQFRRSCKALPPMTPARKAYSTKHRITRKRCQSLVWELLNLHGHFLPPRSELGDQDFDRQTIDTIWEDFECIPVYWVDGSQVVSYAKGHFATTNGLTNVGKGSRPQNHTVMPFIESSCGEIHSPNTMMFDVWLIGSGHLSDEQSTSSPCGAQQEDRDWSAHTSAALPGATTHSTE